MRRMNRSREAACGIGADVVEREVDVSPEVTLCVELASRPRHAPQRLPRGPCGAAYARFQRKRHFRSRTHRQLTRNDLSAVAGAQDTSAQETGTRMLGGCIESA